MKKMIKNYEELNNFYMSLAGKSLSNYQLILIYLLTKSTTAQRLKLDNSLPKEFLLNALLWADIVLYAVCYMHYTINSGYRNTDVNKKVGGVPNSKHLKALAVDFGLPRTTTLQEVNDFIRFINESLSNYANVDYYYRRRNMLHVQLKLK